MTDTVNKQALRDIIAAYEKSPTYSMASNRMLTIAKEELARLEEQPTPPTPVQGYREALRKQDVLEYFETEDSPFARDAIKEVLTMLGIIIPGINSTEDDSPGPSDEQ